MTRPPEVDRDQLAPLDIRKHANSRRFALITRHPAIERVDGDTFWICWRDGWNEMVTTTTRLSALFHQVSECIVEMAAARDAAPPDFIVAAVLLLRHQLPLEDGYTAVRTSDLERLQAEVQAYEREGM